jgi:hypothetical protein
MGDNFNNYVTNSATTTMCKVSNKTFKRFKRGEAREGR